MHPKWIIALATMFVGGTLLAGILEWQYLGNSEAGVFYRLMNDYKEVEFTNVLIAVGTFVGVAWSYVKTVWDLFWWNYAFFDGNWEILKFPFWCLSIGVIVSLVLASVRGVSSG